MSRTHGVRNEVFTREGITDPDRHASLVEVQLAIDGATLPSDAPHHEQSGTELGLRVILDPQRFRPTVAVPIPGTSREDDTRRFIDVVRVGSEHLRVLVDGQPIWELVGQTDALTEPLEAPHVFCVSTSQDILRGAHTGNPTSLTLLSMERFQLDVLETWPSITSLNLYGGSTLTHYEHVESLQRLQALEHLCFRDPGEGFSIDVVKDLERLQVIEISGIGGIEDLSALHQLSALREIVVAKCPDLKSLDGLQALGALEKLDARNCTLLEDVSALRGKSELTHLNLQTCKRITDISVLRDLPSLLELNLMSSQAIKSLDQVENSAKLQSLNLRHSKTLEDIGALEHFPRLNVLMLEGCSGVKDFGPLRHLDALVKLSLRRCKSFDDIGLLEGNTNLEDLNVSNCTYIRDWSPLNHLPGLQVLKGAPPAHRVRALAMHAQRARRTHLIAYRMRLFERTTDGKEESWLDVARREPGHPGLLGILGSATASLTGWDSFETIADATHEAMATLLTLATQHEASGVDMLFEAACPLAGAGPLAAALHRAVQQEERPLPPEALRALADHLPSGPAPWAATVAPTLRDQCLKALIRTLRSTSAPDWSRHSAACLREHLDDRIDAALPDGYPTSRDTHSEALAALEHLATWSDREDTAAHIFGSLASDHARAGNAEWTQDFHQRLVTLALRQMDPMVRDGGLSDIAAGLANAEEPDWGHRALDAMLEAAALVDPDTSALQAAVARAHATAGRWDAAEQAVFAVARPAIRDACLMALADQMLTTDLEDRARRAVALDTGLADPSQRIERLTALGAHQAVLGDPVAYGQLVALLAEHPEAQQQVIRNAVEARPALASAQVPDRSGPVTERERRLAAELERGWNEERTRWHDALEELPAELSAAVRRRFEAMEDQR